MASTRQRPLENTDGLRFVQSNICTRCGDFPWHAHNTHTRIMGLSLVLHHIFVATLSSHIVSTLVVYTSLTLFSVSVTSYL